MKETEVDVTALAAGGDGVARDAEGRVTFVPLTAPGDRVRVRLVKETKTFARGEQVFENVTLPAGSCFVPRIVQKDSVTLRCYFASEAPGKRQAQMYYLDFDIERMASRIWKVKAGSVVITMMNSTRNSVP